MMYCYLPHGAAVELRDGEMKELSPSLMVMVIDRSDVNSGSLTPGQTLLAMHKATWASPPRSHRMDWLIQLVTPETYTRIS